MELGGIIVQKTIELATAFIDSPEYQALQESQRQMENEPEAQRIIQEFQRRQQSLSMLQPRTHRHVLTVADSVRRRHDLPL